MSRLHGQRQYGFLTHQFTQLDLVILCHIYIQRTGCPFGLGLRPHHFELEVALEFYRHLVQTPLTLHLRDAAQMAMQSQTAAARTPEAQLDIHAGRRRRPVLRFVQQNATLQLLSRFTMVDVDPGWQQVAHGARILEIYGEKSMNSDPSETPRLVLASSSRYRAALLGRLGLDFDCQAADIDESPQANESVSACCARLAREKALAVQSVHPAAAVLGSDQLCSLDGSPLGKPGTPEAARAQLSRLSGRSAVFHTAVCLRLGPREWTAMDRTEVQFRALGDEEIERYLTREPALDCAGSFKSEGLGISLFRAIHNQDPTALIGLPLIATAELLREAGFSLP